jgi:tape measure domain-containing protein
VAKDLTLKLTMKADGTVMVKKLKEAKKGIKDLGTETEKTDKKTTRLSGTFKAFGGVIAGIGFARLATSVLNVNREMEALQAQLESVEGSAAKASESFSRIQQFATTTPFQIQDLTKTFIRLKNFGIDPTNDVMLAITNQASKLGASTETLNGIVLALGQAWAKGKLQGEEVLQLVERGVPVYKLLAEATGKNAEELQKMQAKGELTRDVISQLIEKMGELAEGSNARAMDTLNGRISNLADSWVRFQDALLDSEAIDFIKTELTGLIAIIDDLTELLGGEVIVDAGTQFAKLGDEIAKVEAKIAAMKSNGPIGSLIDDLAQNDINEELNKLDRLKKARQELIDQEIKTRTEAKKTQASVKTQSRAAQTEDKSNRSRRSRAAPETKGANKPIFGPDLSGQLRANDSAEQKRLTALFNPELTALNKGIADTQDAQSRGIISEQEAAAEYARLGQIYNDSFIQPAKDGLTELTGAGTDAARVLSSGFHDFLFDDFDEGLKKMLANFVSILAQMAAEAASAAIVDSITGSNTAGSTAGGQAASAAGNIISSIVSSLFHDGGIAGQTSSRRMVNPAIFANAPRYHAGGIAGDEVPAILQKGEEVLTRNDPRHIRNGGGTSINVTVYAKDADSFRKSEGQIGYEMSKELKRWGDMND